MHIYTGQKPFHSLFQDTDRYIMVRSYCVCVCVCMLQAVGWVGGCQLLRGCMRGGGEENAKLGGADG
jgi:hypothetical protein